MPVAADSSGKDPALAVARRGQIATTALRLFRERGFHSTTVREIAQALGVSVGTLFNYFRSKEQILHFIYDQAHEPIERALEDLVDVAVEDPAAALRRALDRFLTQIDRHQDHAILVYQEFKSLDGRAKRQVLDRERRIMEIFERIIDAGIAQGRFRKHPVTVTVNAIMVLGHAWALRRWAFKNAVSLEQFKAVQIDMLLAGLSKPA